MKNSPLPGCRILPVKRVAYFAAGADTAAGADAAVALAAAGDEAEGTAGNAGRSVTTGADASRGGLALDSVRSEADFDNCTG